MRKKEEASTYEDNVIDCINEVIPKKIPAKNIVFVCIGTDRSTGDSLGPMVGTYLQELGYQNVYGTINDPVHAQNLEEVIRKLPKDKVVIAIDACLGQVSSVNKIKVEKGPVRPGAGVNKKLPHVGDFSISGIVNVGGFMEYFVLQNTRLSLVIEMAKKITKGLHNRFPIRKSKCLSLVAATKEEN